MIAVGHHYYTLDACGDGLLAVQEILILYGFTGVFDENGFCEEFAYIGKPHTFWQKGYYLANAMGRMVSSKSRADDGD